MNKFKIGVTQTVRYNHDIYLKTDLSEGQLDSMLDTIQDELSFFSSLDDVAWLLKEEGIKVYELSEDRDGYSSEIEIEDMEEI